MASVIKATFTVDGSEVEIIDVSYSFDQDVDRIGQPAGEVRGGQIVVTMGTNGTADRFGWMVASDMKKSGEIKYTDATGQTLKTVKFEDAYCIGYTETYQAFGGEDGAKETLVLSCRTIDMEGEAYESTWV